MSTGVIKKVAGPLVIAEGMRDANMFDVVRVSNQRLIGEIIEMHGDEASIQVYEETSGLGPGEPVESMEVPMSVELGPGLITSIYDGIQRPLDDIMKVSGNSLKRGVEVPSLKRNLKWEFVPTAKVGDEVETGDVIGTVQETVLVQQKIMVPYGVEGTVKEIKSGEYTVEDVIAFGQNAREELERIQSSQERHDHLQAEKLRLYALAREKAEALTQTRLRAFEELNKRISGTLDFLNMPGVRMTLRHTRGPLASHGQDSIEFYISTNPGEAPKPLAKIASGGELSRITLAIKNAMADKDAVPTVIYDEIDSGVSGKAAGRIGEVLRQSAQGHQILCITHTAQIAALADCHLLIQKNVSNERTYTEIHPLDENGRVEALARLISGDHVTELSRANAREMLQERKHGG